MATGNGPDCAASAELLYPTRASLRGRVGVVIPAWYPPATSPAEAATLLRTTIADSHTCLATADVAVVVDDSPVALSAAQALQVELSDAWGGRFTLLRLPENQGKGGALVAGIRHLLERPGPPLAWIAARDADGDHLLDDLPHLFRAGEQVTRDCPGRLVTVIGRRASVHAPLGWLRGEYELLVDEVLVEAVAFALAGAGAAWDTRYLAGRAPDLQSGYKLYDRAAALLAVQALETEAAAHPDLRLLRSGMEVVPFVALALEGAVFVEVERKTFHDQPVTSYGSVDRPRFYGAKLAWALQRCAVPPVAAALLLDAALIRRPLFTDPAGRVELLDFRRFVLERLCGDTWPEGVPAEPRGRKLL